MPCRRRRWIVLSGLVLAYLTLVTFGGCGDKLILHPTTDPIEANDATRLILPRANGTTDAFVARSPGAQSHEPQAFILEFTGNGTRAEQIGIYVANRWGEHPIETWTVNYPGYGNSTGPATLHSIPSMALAAFDEIAKVAAGRPIIVSGNSLGTTAALWVAANRQAAGLVLQVGSPGTELEFAL